MAAIEENVKLFHSMEEYIDHRDVTTAISNLYLTAHRMNNNLEDIEVLLCSRVLPDVAVVCETWLNRGDEPFFNIPDYRVIHVCREKRGGGVSIFVKSCHTYKEVARYEGIASMLFVQVDSLNVIVGGLYRPPDFDVNTLYEALESKLQQINHYDKMCGLMGDFNINFLTDGFDRTELELFMSSNAFNILNKQVPTRVTPRSQTLIDYAVSNWECRCEDTVKL